jgi:hypothetical protein
MKLIVPYRPTSLESMVVERKTDLNASRFDLDHVTYSRQPAFAEDV